MGGRVDDGPGAGCNARGDARSGPGANLYLNTGHGTLGWTMAAGSGRAPAEILPDRAPKIAMSDLGYARHQRDGSRAAPQQLAPATI